ncbi:MAG: FAD-dependent oxidoreductase [Thermodesulfobacteriota bacterium]|nr:FAD-dependent oxidoreductase [Thermodesulfobacteriota bacterium]
MSDVFSSFRIQPCAVLARPLPTLPFHSPLLSKRIRCPYSQERFPAAECQAFFKFSCQPTCPIGMDASDYITLIPRIVSTMGIGSFSEPINSSAYVAECATISANSNAGDLPWMSLNIKYLKRFIADNTKMPLVKRVLLIRKGRVSVIGTGPSGMTVAKDLTPRGCAVVIFEELPEAGGMLQYGSPEYRLPRDILKAEIEDIIALGVELRCNTKVGRDAPCYQVKKEFDAIYLAVGAHRSIQVGVDGEEIEDACGAVEFLRELNLGKKSKVEERVAVIGGGNSAVDASRCALRLGAKEITILYRMLCRDMPAHEEEIRAAEEEGVKIEYLIASIRFSGDNGHL